MARKTKIEQQNIIEVEDLPQEAEKKSGKTVDVEPSIPAAKKTKKAAVKTPPPPQPPQPPQEVVVEEKSKDENSDDAEEKADDGSRTFKLVLESISPPIENLEKLPKRGGRYVGKSPLQAGKKAYSRLRNASGEPRASFNFTIKETTRGSSKKDFTYSGLMQKLAKPRKIKRGDRTWDVDHTALLHAVKESQEVTPQEVVEPVQPLVPESKPKTTKKSKGKRVKVE